MRAKISEIIQDLVEIDNALDAGNIRNIDDITIFNQTWPSTSLGFGGIGGQAFTTAPTTVIQLTDGGYLVFFGGRLAYCVVNPTKEFKEDLRAGRMVDCATAKKRY